MYWLQTRSIVLCKYMGLALKVHKSSERCVCNRMVSAPVEMCREGYSPWKRGWLILQEVEVVCFWKAGEGHSRHSKPVFWEWWAVWRVKRWGWAHCKVCHIQHNQPPQFSHGSQWQLSGSPFQLMTPFIL